MISTTWQIRQSSSNRFLFHFSHKKTPYFSHLAKQSGAMVNNVGYWSLKDKELLGCDLYNYLMNTSCVYFLAYLLAYICL